MRTTLKLVTLLMLLVIGMALATARPPTLNWGSETNAAECDTQGSPLINVHRNVVNSMDSGFGDDVWWAYDDYRQNIKVYNLGNDTYCVVSQYQGQFDGVAGQDSPADNGTLTGEEDGTFQGGYHATFTADLRENFTASDRGSIGTTDYNCDVHTGNCPGQENWMDHYFTNVQDFTYEWWGWIYHGGDCGTWVNAQDGSSGDVLCDDAPGNSGSTNANTNANGNGNSNGNP